MSAVDKLLSRLDGVKQTGTGRWIAKCPSHEDRRPSLSIREVEDGMVLVHCFTGCGGAEVIAAAGLEFSDLYPERLPAHDYHKGARRPAHAEDVLRCVAFESLLTATAASNLAQGYELTEQDRQRLWTAVERLQRAATLGAGHA